MEHTSNWRRKIHQFNNLVCGKNFAFIPQSMKLRYQKNQQAKEIIETLITHTDTLPLENYVLDKSGVMVCSERGATLPSLILDDVEIFYNEPERRNDPTKKIREGFRMGPQSGAFTPEQNAKYGYDLQQHGFLRDVARKKEKIAGKEIGYQFETDENTLKKFPYQFIASQKIELGYKGARISLHVKNDGKNMMRFAPGHHTYYKVSPDQKERIRVSENMGVDDEMKSKWISGIETIKILNPGSCQVFIPGTGLLQLNFDSQFKYLRLRSEKDKGFVCIKPVVCHYSEWNDLSIIIKPEEVMKVGFTITLLSKDNT